MIIMILNFWTKICNSEDSEEYILLQINLYLFDAN